jgi:hypothetical protein
MIRLLWDSVPSWQASTQKAASYNREHSIHFPIIGHISSIEFGITGYLD